MLNLGILLYTKFVASSTVQVTPPTHIDINIYIALKDIAMQTSTVIALVNYSEMETKMYKISMYCYQYLFHAIIVKI